jgi:hypothetical protein
VDRLLAGREKGIGVDMHNGLRPGGYDEELVGHDVLSACLILKNIESSGEI